MIGNLVTGISYVLAAFLGFGAAILLAHFAFQFVPGPYGNSLRRLLFTTCHPILSMLERIAPLRFAAWDLTPLLAALFLLILLRYAVPWAVLLGLALGG